MKIDWKKFSVHNDKEIKGFFGEYRWLSNFHLCTIHFDGREYLSSENAYQAAKVTDSMQHHFAKGGVNETPQKAKKEIKNYPLAIDIKYWDKIKTAVMRDVLDAKFLQNNELLIKLVQTGDKYIEELNCWNDTFWGVDYKTGNGENNLGKILMRIRENWAPVLLKNDINIFNTFSLS